MGGWPRCHGAEEHVACTDLPHLEGLVATGTLVDESLKRRLEYISALCPNLVIFGEIYIDFENMISFPTQSSVKGIIREVSSQLPRN